MFTTWYFSGSCLVVTLRKRVCELSFRIQLLSLSECIILLFVYICSYLFTLSLQGSSKERKRHFVVHSEGREIISNIIEKCDEENKETQLT